MNDNQSSLLSEIRVIEEQCYQRLGEAKKEAQQIIEKAQREAQQIIEQSEEEAEKASKLFTETEMEKIQAEIEQIEAEGEQMVAKARIDGERNLDRAVDRIVNVVSYE